MNRVLLIDGFWGTNLPATFFDIFDLPSWGLDTNDYLALRDADTPDYWDAWDEVMQHAVYVDKDGVRWRLEQDGDLFAVALH